MQPYGMARRYRDRPGFLERGRSRELGVNKTRKMNADEPQGMSAIGHNEGDVADRQHGKRRTLGNDIARCDGVGSDAEGWREGCEDCLRRTAPRHGGYIMTSPPPIIALWCEMHIPEVIYE